MEAQEFGEMIEHVDEVNFALDGLRPRQPVRIRRSSLLSLLSICGTAQQRRLLRAQGMSKRIVDSILVLNFEDSPSTLAVATLFFVLASDDDEALMQGEQEAEMMIIEAYAALLLSFLSTESAEVREAIASCLPNHNLEALVPVLERFVAFHVQLNMISPETHSAVN